MVRVKALVVLVVEDEPLVLMMALDIVADAGFEALAAANADEAIAILESRTRGSLRQVAIGQQSE
jgi:CheY-like chemotaxis protein